MLKFLPLQQVHYFRYEFVLEAQCKQDAIHKACQPFSENDRKPFVFTKPVQEHRNNERWDQ